APNGFSRCFHSRKRGDTSFQPSARRVSSRTARRSSAPAGRRSIVMPRVSPRSSVRAVLKRAARQAAKVTAAAVDAVHRPPRGLVVLIYPRVGRRSAIEVDLPLPLFRDQIDFLAARTQVVSLADGLARVSSPAATPIPLVAVTFDDG